MACGSVTSFLGRRQLLCHGLMQWSVNILRWRNGNISRSCDSSELLLLAVVSGEGWGEAVIVLCDR